MLDADPDAERGALDVECCAEVEAEDVKREVDVECVPEVLEEERFVDEECVVFVADRGAADDDER